MRPSPFPTSPMLFVCCAERDGGIEACGAKGRHLLLALQAAADRRGMTDVEFVPSGCLGHCAADPVVVLDGRCQRVWCGVKREDVNFLLDGGDKTP